MTPTGLVISTASVAGSSLASVIAQAVAENGNGVTITSAGATASAVGALIYVARLMATGQLVAKQTIDGERRAEEDIAALVKSNATRVEIVADANKREDRFYNLVAMGKLPRMPEDR